MDGVSVLFFGMLSVVSFSFFLVLEQLYGSC
jgi:hypothetical protein